MMPEGPPLRWLAHIHLSQQGLRWSILLQSREKHTKELLEVIIVVAGGVCIAHNRVASHVMRMVQLNPRSVTKPKLLLSTGTLPNLCKAASSPDAGPAINPPPMVRSCTPSSDQIFVDILWSSILRKARATRTCDRRQGQLYCRAGRYDNEPNGGLKLRGRRQLYF